MKIFDRWDMKGIEVKDEGIRDYINLDPMLVPKTGGKHAKKKFYKSKLNVVERLINHLFVVGHRGKKHKTTSGSIVGKTNTVAKIVEGAFEVIEKKTNKNPIEVLVRAIENAAPLEEVITYQKGGIFERESVVTSPQRRVDLALKHLTQGTYQKSHKSKKKAFECLAEEIIAAVNNDNSSFAISEKNRREKESAGAI